MRTPQQESEVTHSNGQASQKQTTDTFTELIKQLKENPYSGLALAVGTGVILGGGIWKHMFRSLITMSARFAVALATSVIVESISPVRSAVSP